MIVAVIAIIAAAALLFTKKIDNAATESITPKRCSELISELCQTKLRHDDYARSHHSFDSIIGVITTEEFVSLGNGEKQTEAEEIARCRITVADEYDNYLVDYSAEYFRRSQWNKATLNNMKADALILLDLRKSASNILNEKDREHEDVEAPATEDMDISDNQIREIASTVDDYSDALSVVNNASRCYSIDKLEEIIQKVSNYKRIPLTNNAELSAGLNSAISEAKESVVNSICRQCDRVANNFRSFGSYSNFINEYNKAINRIKEYESRYGYNSKLSEAQNSMDNAEKEAVDYYDIGRGGPA